MFFDTIIDYIIPLDLITKYQTYLDELKTEKSKTTDINPLKKIIPINYDFDGEKNLDRIIAKTLIICSK